MKSIKNQTKNKKGTNGKPTAKKAGVPFFGAKSDAKPDKNLKNKVLKDGATVAGTIQGTGKGFAFFIPETGEADVFIPANALGGAIHGDRVIVRKTTGHRGGGEGEVVKVLERKYTQVVGVYDGAAVVCSERGFGTLPCVVANGGANANKGDKVVAKLVDTRYGLKCLITEVLGKAGETGADVMGVIRMYGIPETFPEEVMRAADALPDNPTAEQIKGRRDFRGDTIITIDGAHSKDFDDAISVKRTDDGGYLLGVHIADVSEYVTEGSVLDREAFERGTSVYFADRVIPMLPEKLSNGVCSLNEGVDRLTLSVIMRFDPAANLVSHEICKGVIRSAARTTYEGVQDLLDGQGDLIKYGFLMPMLSAAKPLAELLMAKRAARGAVEFDVGECEIVMDGEKVVDVVRREHLFTHKMIEEFMLVTNETVAEHFEKLHAPFVFRVHEDPPADKVDNLIGFLDSLGLALKEKPTPDDYKKLLESTPDDVKNVVNRVSLRSMAKAEYRPQNLGHFGLAAEFYCHFTSPIRRYPDLAIHRIIKYVLDGGKKPERFGEFVKAASVHSSEREKRAEEAERRVDDLLKAKFMEDKIGNEYDATVSGVTERGIFAELDNYVEGMIHVEDLPGSGYVYDEKRLVLRSPLHTFRFGDRIRIKVGGVYGEGKINFLLADAFCELH